MSRHEELVQTFTNRNPLPPLKPANIWNEQLSEEIMTLSDQEVTGTNNPSSLAVSATRSGLLLWNDDLYGSHTVSQSIKEPVGSYWHGIMHRQEADYGNAKYWFSNVGEHEVYASLYQEAIKILPEIKEWGSWNPNLFIDLVAEEVSKNYEQSEKAEKLRQIQAVEFALLLEYSRTI